MLKEQDNPTPGSGGGSIKSEPPATVKEEPVDNTTSSNANNLTPASSADAAANNKCGLGGGLQDKQANGLPKTELDIPDIKPKLEDGALSTNPLSGRRSTYPGIMDVNDKGKKQTEEERSRSHAEACKRWTNKKMQEDPNFKADEQERLEKYYINVHKKTPQQRDEYNDHQLYVMRGRRMDAKLLEYREAGILKVPEGDTLGCSSKAPNRSSKGRKRHNNNVQSSEGNVTSQNERSTTLGKQLKKSTRKESEVLCTTEGRKSKHIHSVSQGKSEKILIQTDELNDSYDSMEEISDASTIIYNYEGISLLSDEDDRDILEDSTSVKIITSEDDLPNSTSPGCSSVLQNRSFEYRREHKIDTQAVEEKVTTTDVHTSSAQVQNTTNEKNDDKYMQSVTDFESDQESLEKYVPNDSNHSEEKVCDDDDIIKDEHGYITLLSDDNDEIDIPEEPNENTYDFGYTSLFNDDNNERDIPEKPNENMYDHGYIILVSDDNDKRGIVEEPNVDNLAETNSVEISEVKEEENVMEETDWDISFYSCEETVITFGNDDNDVNCEHTGTERIAPCVHCAIQSDQPYPDVLRGHMKSDGLRRLSLTTCYQE